MPDPTREEVIDDRRRAKAVKIAEIFHNHQITAAEAIMILSDRNPSNAKWWKDFSSAMVKAGNTEFARVPSEQTRLEVIRQLAKLERK